MILLAVDDERYILNSIKNNINKEIVGITEILFATSAQQAKKILQNNAVDIILCDIEMPQENGLSLLLWVNEYYPDILSIVLTCHDNFEYIRSAIRLNVVDYLLKPVSMQELHESIKKVAAQYKKRMELNRLSEYGKYWAENHTKLVEGLWQDILTGNIVPDNIEIANQAKIRNLDFDMTQLYIPVCIQLIEHIGGVAMRDMKVGRSAIKNIARSMAIKGGESGAVLEMEKDTLLCIFPIGNGVSFKSVYECCEEIVATADTFLSYSLFCYIGQKSQPNEMVKAQAHLSAFVKTDVARKNHVVLLSEAYSQKQREGMSPNLNILAVLLLNDAFGRAKEEAIGLLQVDYADQEYLIKFYQSFLKAVFSVLEKQGFPHEAFMEKVEYKNNAPDFSSIHAIQDWTLKIIDLLAESSGKTTIVSKVKNYIREHLGERLTREELAKLVFLHADYLNYVFKRECGLSLHEYITGQRMDFAKILLADTTIPTSSIAHQIGYNNFSQFSKQFKKATGSAPMEFRKACTK